MLKSSKDAYTEMQNDYTWSTELSDGSTIDISPKGSGGNVSFDERLEYVQRALRVRLAQSDVQCKAIKNGIAQIIPEALLNIGTFEELEEWVSGKNYIDVEMLKRNTVYSGVDYMTEDSQVVKFFW